MARIETPTRRAAERRGRAAEWVAMAFLALKGYRPLALRARTPVGEIDLIVKRGRRVAIVEVKARATVAAGLDAVTLRQQARMAKAADWWLARHAALQGHDLAFDLVVVAPFRLPVHIPGAFEPHA